MFYYITYSETNQVPKLAIFARKPTNFTMLQKFPHFCTHKMRLPPEGTRAIFCENRFARPSSAAAAAFSYSSALPAISNAAPQKFAPLLKIHTFSAIIKEAPHRT